FGRTDPVESDKNSSAMRYSPFFGWKTKKSSHPAGSAKQGGYREMLKFSISLQADTTVWGSSCPLPFLRHWAAILDFWVDKGCCR
ncbi:hypothetical protein, partial [Microseira sp. BLCC-F43]|uniref:hypothetical protein n=1 Tax=Microseira sp. BLCC-F43 TaxID=3153602 RepID=UPI0035BA4B2B